MFYGNVHLWQKIRFYHWWYGAVYIVKIDTSYNMIGFGLEISSFKKCIFLHFLPKVHKHKSNSWGGGRNIARSLSNSHESIFLSRQTYLGLTSFQLKNWISIKPATSPAYSELPNPAYSEFPSPPYSELPNPAYSEFPSPAYSELPNPAYS